MFAWWRIISGKMARERFLDSRLARLCLLLYSVTFGSSCAKKWPWLPILIWLNLGKSDHIKVVDFFPSLFSFLHATSVTCMIGKKWQTMSIIPLSHFSKNGAKARVERELLLDKSHGWWSHSMMMILVINFCTLKFLRQNDNVISTIYFGERTKIGEHKST